MARSSLLVLVLVLAFAAFCNATGGLRGLQSNATVPSERPRAQPSNATSNVTTSSQQNQNQSTALNASTDADKHGRYGRRRWGRGYGWRALKGQQKEEATRAGGEEQAQNATARAGERERPAAGNETRAQRQPANASTAAGEEQRPVNASEANSTDKHIAVVVGRPYLPPYYGYGYPSGYGYGGGCGYGCGYGWRKLQANATAQNATEAKSANTTTATARPGEQRTGGTNQSEARRPPVANAITTEPQQQQQNETRAEGKPAGQQVNVDASKDWDGHHGGWDGHHHHGGWDGHHHHGGWDGHHHHGGWGGHHNHGHWHA